jgi:predicted nucleic acid-binding protein
VERVFVDTSGWYAAADSRDPDHGAVARWLRRNTLPLITTDYVFDETVTLVRIELGHPAAVRFGENVRASAAVQIVSVTAEDREAAWQIFKKFEDQRLSFTDCTSFAVMKRLGLAQTLTVDQHFLLMGFVPVTQI